MTLELAEDLHTGKKKKEIRLDSHKIHKSQFLEN